MKPSIIPKSEGAPPLAAAGSDRLTPATVGRPEGEGAEVRMGPDVPAAADVPAPRQETRLGGR